MDLIIKSGLNKYEDLDKNIFHYYIGFSGSIKPLKKIHKQTKNIKVYINGYNKFSVDEFFTLYALIKQYKPTKMGMIDGYFPLELFRKSYGV